MPKREEQQEQILLVKWFRMQFPDLANLLVHIPNGQNVGVRAGKILKDSGLVKGFPDLFLFYPTRDFCGLAIEMKRKDGGQISKEQGEMLDLLNSYEYLAVVACGFEQAQQTIIMYMNERIELDESERELDA